LPQSVLKAWREERETIVKDARDQKRRLSPLEESRLRELQSEKIESSLDAGLGACWMNDPGIAGIVSSTLNHFHGTRYELLAWCVMPNHVHTVASPLQGHTLPEILHSWKSYSAKECNRALGRSGTFWQEESYDHLVRDQEDFRRVVEYTLENPVRAGLKGWRWLGGCAATNRREDAGAES
jgi:REP element-mobilizing transposase RayT